MNNTEMMETLAIQTNEDAMTIESILKSYEHYCNENITLSCNHRLYHC